VSAIVATLFCLLVCFVCQQDYSKVVDEFLWDFGSGRTHNKKSIPVYWYSKIKYKISSILLVFPFSAWNDDHLTNFTTLQLPWEYELYVCQFYFVFVALGNFFCKTFVSLCILIVLIVTFGLCRNTWNASIRRTNIQLENGRDLTLSNLKMYVLSASACHLMQLTAEQKFG